MPPGRKRGVSSLGTYTSSKKRRRTSNTTKVKFQRPTARNQRKQILSNSRKLNTLARVVYQQRVYCDWHTANTMYATWDASGAFSETWGAWPLTDFPTWTAVLRQDVNVADSAHTFLKRLQINFRYALQAANWAQYNVFIISMRKDAANYDPATNISVGAFPVVNLDYVQGQSDFNIRLNSAKYKVHYARYVTLTSNGLFEATSTTMPAGNAFSTWRKAQYTKQVNSSYRQAAGTTRGWTQIAYQNQPYYQRYFLLVKIISGNNPVADAGKARFDWDQLATTVNFS